MENGTVPAKPGTGEAMTILSYVASIVLVMVSQFFDVDSAWALQSHAEPEGIYVHQMAHLLFISGLGYLLWHTRRTQETTSKGWISLQIFCAILVLWNLIAFCGHIAFEHLTTNDFMERGSFNEKIVGPITFIKGLYFITKMDHLLLVPAVLALVVSLRSFYIDAQEKRQ